MSWALRISVVRSSGGERVRRQGSCHGRGRLPGAVERGQHPKLEVEMGEGVAHGAGFAPVGGKRRGAGRSRPSRCRESRACRREARAPGGVPAAVRRRGGGRPRPCPAGWALAAWRPCAAIRWRCRGRGRRRNRQSGQMAQAGVARRADRGAEVHHRLREIAGSFGRGRCARRPRPVRASPRAAGFRWRTAGPPPSRHCRRPRWRGHRRRWRQWRRRYRGRCRAGRAKRQDRPGRRRVPVNHRAGAGDEVAGASVVAEPRPFGHHRGVFGRRQRRDIRPERGEAVVIALAPRRRWSAAASPRRARRDRGRGALQVPAPRAAPARAGRGHVPRTSRSAPRAEFRHAIFTPHANRQVLASPAFGWQE